MRDVQYVGPVTSYHVTLDRGGELQVLAQNLEEGSSEVLEAKGRRVSLEWRPEQESVIENRRRIRMRRKRIAVGRAGLARGRSARWPPAAAAGTTGSAVTEIEGLGSTLEEIKANAKTEGKVDLVAWAYYVEDGSNDPNADWVTGFEKDTGCDVSARLRTRPTRW